LRKGERFDRALVLGGRDVYVLQAAIASAPLDELVTTSAPPHIRKKPNERGPFADALMNTRRCSAETNVIEFDTE
jgi:hypothetical protein